MLTRLRCTLCKNLVEATVLVKNRHQALAERLGHTPETRPDFFKPVHKVWSQRGVIDCGPVEEEEVSDYVLCLERFIDNT